MIRASSRLCLAVAVRIVGVCHCTLVAEAVADRWVHVRQILDTQPLLKDVSLIVGDGDKRLFHHNKGNMTLDRPLWVASSSKMVFVVRAMQLVEKGVVSLHDPVNKYLPYWAKKASDPRSRITLFHCLTFQSGYTFGLNQGDACWTRPWLDFSSCVERLYRTLPHMAEPGTVWDYNEFHNQIVAAVLEKVTGVKIGALLNEDLKSWNMTHSSYVKHEGPGGPDVSSDLVTTAIDYEQFLFRYFGGRLLSNQSVAIMEADHMPSHVSSESEFLQVAQGHYGIGNWWFCPNDLYPYFHKSKVGPLPKRCLDANVHSDQGLFGFWPVWDRRLGYWFIFVVDGLPLVGDAKTLILQYVIKPLIDHAVTQSDLNDSFGSTMSSVPLTVKDWEALEAILRERRGQHIRYASSQADVVV